MRVLSLGGGTQSCALALMSAAGEIDRLDHVIFADTQAELPETYAYIDYLRGQLDAAGIPLHVVTSGSLEAALLSPVPVANNPTPPVHVRKPDGTKGRIGQYRCSWDFKRRVIARTMKQLVGPRGAWKRADVEQWIGFSADEIGRTRRASECRCTHVAGSHRPACSAPKCGCERFDPWQTNRWPLIELGMRRDETIRWFGRNGHPVPVRSACWFCPNSGNDRWTALRRDHPDLFARAVTVDTAIRNGAGFNLRGRVRFDGEMFLHPSLTPLPDADIRTDAQRAADNGQASLFGDDALTGDCSAGTCFT